MALGNENKKEEDGSERGDDADATRSLGSLTHARSPASSGERTTMDPNWSPPFIPEFMLVPTSPLGSEREGVGISHALGKRTVFNDYSQDGKQRC